MFPAIRKIHSIHLALVFRIDFVKPKRKEKATRRVDTIVEKLLGKSALKGIDPVDTFCRLWDAGL